MAISEVSLGGILLLAAADAVNPCALAVLTLVLISVLTARRKRSIVLQAGLAFTLSVYLFYFLYGIIMVGLFKGAALAIAPIRVYLFKTLGAFAVILGLFNLRDFVRYKPGGLMTEMPLSIRPKMKKLVSQITSPKGAFFIGIFVTLFLLPCTIGPYVAASGILSVLDFFKVFLWLLLYNAVFVLPMIAVTLIVYWGYASVEQVGGWKEENIRYLHLITGIILFCIGAAMIMGWL